MAFVNPETKIAATDYDIHTLIKKRWSPRAFSDKPIERDLLRQLIDAARWAPSSYNEQPWRFIIATKDHPDEYERMEQVLGDFNKQWATTAPVLILTLAKNHFAKNERPNKHAVHDLGQAVSSMTFEAARHNIFLHQMAGILPEEGRALFHVPDHYTPITMIALGYAGDVKVLPNNLQEQEQATRNRLDIDEIIFRGQWDNPKRL